MEIRHSILPCNMHSVHYATRGSEHLTFTYVIDTLVK